MKEPLDYEEYTRRANYQLFIKQYLKEIGVPLKPWEVAKPLYLRYRARCLKLRPESYEQFKNLCLFEPTRKTKYTDKGELKEGEKAGWDKKEDTVRAGTRDKICRIRKDYKLNYKAPPKKEDFEFTADYRLAYKDWSYLKAELADYEAVKMFIEKFENGQHTAATGENNPDLLNYPWLIRYALKCLGGIIPEECFPESLTNYREELEELLNKQKVAYSTNGREDILNDLKAYTEED